VSRPDCAREQEVVNAVLSGAWPERAAAGLTTEEKRTAIALLRKLGLAAAE